MKSVCFVTACNYRSFEKRSDFERHMASIHQRFCCPATRRMPECMSLTFSASNKARDHFKFKHNTEAPTKFRARIAKMKEFAKSPRTRSPKPTEPARFACTISPCNHKSFTERHEHVRHLYLIHGRFPCAAKTPKEACRHKSFGSRILAENHSGRCHGNDEATDIWKLIDQLNPNYRSKGQATARKTSRSHRDASHPQTTHSLPVRQPPKQSVSKAINEDTKSGMQLNTNSIPIQAGAAETTASPDKSDPNVIVQSIEILNTPMNKGIFTFQATMQHLEDFDKFIEEMEQSHSRGWGVFKIILPKELIDVQEKVTHPPDDTISTPIKLSFRPTAESPHIKHVTLQRIPTIFRYANILEAWDKQGSSGLSKTELKPLENMTEPGEEAIEYLEFPYFHNRLSNEFRGIDLTASNKLATENKVLTQLLSPGSTKGWLPTNSTRRLFCLTGGKQIVWQTIRSQDTPKIEHLRDDTRTFAIEEQFWTEQNIQVYEFTQNQNELIITTVGGWWAFRSTGFAKLETTLYATAKDAQA